MARMEYESEQERKDEEEFNNEDHQMNFGEQKPSTNNVIRSNSERPSGQPEQIVIQSDQDYDPEEADP